VRQKPVTYSEETQNTLLAAKQHLPEAGGQANVAEGETLKQILVITGKDEK